MAAIIPLGSWGHICCESSVPFFGALVLGSALCVFSQSLRSPVFKSFWGLGHIGASPRSRVALAEKQTVKVVEGCAGAATGTYIMRLGL